ncbi:PRD domain-containing protein [Streptobacillus canis]|uniref:PRD domain-containing protein n=1 Tax=Streptobacillus canis TaxID=2678686 RepID=UPI0012E23EBC|nr:PRD domain-containing protein [Streptobacillus canis]
MENLKMRLDILKQAGVIDENISTKVLKVIEMFKEKYKIILTEENGSMLITHLTMMLKRMRDNESINELESEEVEELKTFSVYNKAVEIYSSIEEVIEEKIEENEYGFMMTHLITLLGGQ